MDPLLIPVLIGFGVLAGLLGALLGIGGGIVIVPAMTLVFGLSMQEAVGVSLLGIVATSSGATSYYLERGMCNIRLAMTLETFTAIGSIVGAVVAIYMDQAVLAMLFGAVMVYMAVYMVRRPERLAAPRDEEGGICGMYVAPSGETVRYRATHIRKGLGAGFLAGNLCGMLGMGGGSIKVPVMNIVMGVPLRVAIGTSNLMVGITAVAAAMVYLANGLMSPVFAGSMASGVLIGSMSGARLSHLVPAARLKRWFSILLLLVAAMMVLKGLGVIA